MGENLRDRFYHLFGMTSGFAVICTSLMLIKQLLDDYEKTRLETEVEIQKACDKFREALEDDSVEECVSGIRKDFEAEIEKKDDDQKVCSDSLEECPSDARKVLEDSIEDRKRDDGKLHSDVQECFTDIKKLLEV